MFFLLFCVLLPQDHIEKVRVGTLDHNDLARIGLVFEHYRYFESHTWREEKDDQGRVVVVFEGIIPDDKATKDYHAENQYAFRRSFKAMQLAPYYDLDENKEKLRYILRFTFETSGGFVVSSGLLGTLSKKGEWRDRTLKDRAVMALLEGIYSNENPYVSLINGLPFK